MCVCDCANGGGGVIKQIGNWAGVGGGGVVNNNLYRDTGLH